MSGEQTDGQTDGQDNGKPTKKPRKARTASGSALVDASWLDSGYGRAATVKACREMVGGIEVEPGAPAVQVAIVCVREVMEVRRELLTVTKRVKGV